MLTDEDRQQILRNVLDIIESISDREYQKRVWIRGEGPECDGFDDTVCDFFGDCDPMLSEYRKFRLTEQQYQLLKNFRDQFEQFSDKTGLPFDFTDLPEWIKIADLAKEVLIAFVSK